MHATYRNRVAKRTQHVVSNNVARCCVEMLRAFGQAFKFARRGPRNARQSAYLNLRRVTSSFTAAIKVEEKALQ